MHNRGFPRILEHIEMLKWYRTGKEIALLLQIIVTTSIGALGGLVATADEICSFNS